MRLFIQSLAFTFCVGLVLSSSVSAQIPATLPKEDKPKDDKAKTAKKYTDKDGGFAVLFPAGKVQKQTKKIDTPGGELEIKLFIVADEKTGAAYIVSYNAMPEGTKNVDPETILDGTQKGVIQQGKLVSSKPVKFSKDKIPAREVVFDNNASGADLRFRVLIILKDETLYQVLVGGTDDFGDTDKAKAFIKSFELTAKKKVDD
jgi:hypothetical protein